MPVVPQELDALDRLIEYEERIARLEQGCGATTGGGDADGGMPPEAPVTPPAAAMTRTIKLRAQCKTNAAGALKFPNGTPWQFIGTAGVMEGSGATTERPATPGTVRLNTVLKWNPQGSGELNPTRQVGFPRSLMFKLPPGWWPLRLETFNVPVEGGRGYVEVTPDTGHVYFVPAYGCRPKRVDLTSVMFKAGGGADGQGDGTLDPTGCGDGSPWEGDTDNANEPAMSVETGGGGGGWTRLSMVNGWTGDADWFPAYRLPGDGTMELIGVAYRNGSANARFHSGAGMPLPPTLMLGHCFGTDSVSGKEGVFKATWAIDAGIAVLNAQGSPDNIDLSGTRFPLTRL